MDYELRLPSTTCWSIGAGLVSQESRVDARGADENLACAFVFLAKPAGLHHAGYNPAIIFVFLAVCTKPAATLVLPSSSGSPYTVGKEPESATAPPS